MGGFAAGKLDLDPVVVARARELARRVGQPVVELARGHTTVSVERAVLRLAGVTGADPDGIPWVNRLVDAVVADVGLGHGVAVPVFEALARERVSDVTLLAQQAAAGSVRFVVPSGRSASVSYTQIR
ncbi:lysine 2,3-aminomutase, partial [Verrucosispora sp. SN26_14.1]|uniref:lysine 5,6-aminomutase subunit alpha TIM-barrel domain-containing protein n=1 Tax=Verrucosispora sp. SN26_14.1 TaxID=2527879 RepID=UPI0010DB544B